MASHDMSEQARLQAASRGEALPDGSYPTRDCEELKGAITAYEREKEELRPALRRYLIRRSVQLGCTEHIPDSWEVENVRTGERTQDRDVNGGPA